MKIVIDPRSNVVFASSYIYGLWQIFGKGHVKFSMRYFNELIQNKGIDDFDQYFSFVVVENNQVAKKIVVDFRDKNNYSLDALKWCDRYAKVNYNTNVSDYIDLDESYKNKILSFGPNFTFNLWNKQQTIINLLSNYLKGLGKHPVSFRQFIASYNFQLKRAKLRKYTSSTSKADYIFFVSNLYKENQLSDASKNGLDEFLIQTNQNRAAYIRACKNTQSQFEGGMVASGTHPNHERYKDVITSQYVKPEDYLEKIKKSAIVFNASTVWGCHGWKLVEFLAMGKAIISLPLHNEVAHELVHGQHIHFINNLSEMPEAVNKIIEDKEYRKQLEKGAKTYYNQYLEPTVVMERLLNVTLQNK